LDVVVKEGFVLPIYRIKPRVSYVAAECRKLHNAELRDLNPSPSIIRIIKLRRMRWAGHVAWMREKRSVYRLLEGKP
jgi:hypothetical protein